MRQQSQRKRGIVKFSELLPLTEITSSISDAHWVQYSVFFKNVHEIKLFMQLLVLCLENFPKILEQQQKKLAESLV